jgi:hypothetical protein
MTNPNKTHFVRVTAEVHHAARLAAANLSTLTDRRVPQYEALAIGLALLDAHPDEVRAALGVTA